MLSHIFSSSVSLHVFSSTKHTHISLFSSRLYLVSFVITDIRFRHICQHTSSSLCSCLMFLCCLLFISPVQVRSIKFTYIYLREPFIQSNSSHTNPYLLNSGRVTVNMRKYQASVPALQCIDMVCSVKFSGSKTVCLYREGAVRFGPVRSC